ncbi:unnamed protein product [Pedinophyceae sp. YPF-701]|nr:unnamed protein product [Pedinophyceae sp. YPF-701]
MSPIHVRVGVLAIQGSFREHLTALNRIEGVEGIEVRTTEDLRACSGLIIPGGESTTMANVCERWGLIAELQKFHRDGHPIWGTCAGLIFLAKDIGHGAKQGGQQLIGGLDVKVSRNFFGAQINSFETMLEAPASLPDREQGACRALFIRAPAIVEVGEGVEVLSRYTLSDTERQQHGVESVVVGVRQGALMATSFHPELTDDVRWHKLFVEMVRESGPAEMQPYVPKAGRGRPNDLPIFGKTHMCA